MVCHPSRNCPRLPGRLPAGCADLTGGKQPSMTTIGRDPAGGEEQQLRHCRGDEHQSQTRRRFGTWRKGQHGEAQRHGRREIAQYGHAAGEDQNSLGARHRPIVSFQILK
jgi:hypothetical protein